MQMIDEEGNVVFWTDINNGGGADRLVLSMADGSFLIAARRGSPSPIGGSIGSMDAWPSVHGLRGTLNAATPGASGGALSAHMMFNRCGSVVSVPEVSLKPGVFELAQNYPNPFNPITTISFSLPSQSFVSLRVFDVLGREVSVLVSQNLPAGTYSRSWDGSGFAGGVYFYSLKAGEYSETKKLLLLR